MLSVSTNNGLCDPRLAITGLQPSAFRPYWASEHVFVVVLDEPHWMDVLVDILLSLLGRSGDLLPFGPLREACEALFRAFVEQVTPQGFADLARVVQQSPEGQADDEDLFEEEDEDMLAGNIQPKP